MRAVFVGINSLTIMAATLLVKRGHEVIIIERDKDKIAAVQEQLDSGILHGDATRPALLREAGPDQTEVLFCLTGNDQTNIITSLIARSLKFKRVVTKIEDPAFEHICTELGLDNTIIPSRTIGRYLADMFEHQDYLELSTVLRHDARMFSFVVQEENAGPLADLGLPAESRVICLYRDDTFIIPDADTAVQANDEIVIITHQKHLAALRERWAKPTA